MSKACKSCLSVACATKLYDFGSVDVDSTEAASDHPNKSIFTGTLLFVDEPSNRPPHGSSGHAILVPKNVAVKEIPTLIGMGVNVQSDLAGHDPKKKIGVITRAWIHGNRVRVRGMLWSKDFPEALRLLKANRGDLGMSMELGDVWVRDTNADVWELEKFHFTGATILLQQNAAYGKTSLAAAKNSGGKMSKEKDKGKAAAANDSGGSGQQIATAIAAAIDKTLTAGLEKIAKDFSDSNGKVVSILEKVDKNVRRGNSQLYAAIEAIALGDEVNADATEEDDIAAKADDATDDSTSGGDATDSTDSTDMRTARGDATDASAARDATDASAARDATDASAAGDEEADAIDVTDASQLGDDFEPGSQNPEAKEHARMSERGKAANRTGRHGSEHGKVKTPAGIHGSASPSVIRHVRAQQAKINELLARVQESEKANKTLQKAYREMKAQVERAANQTERRSVGPEVTHLLEKNGYDIRELYSSQQKFTVHQVDEILANAGVTLDVKTRMAIKNQMVAAGLMDDGAMRRPLAN